LVKVSTSVGIATKPQNSQLIEVSISLGIASLNEESTLNVIPTFQMNPFRWFGYP
jgi:hypothetical protein